MYSLKIVVWCTISKHNIQKLTEIQFAVGNLEGEEEMKMIINAAVNVCRAIVSNL